jgi:iron complex transport system permease protein
MVAASATFRGKIRRKRDAATAARVSPVVLMPALVALLVVAVVLSAGIGAVHVGPMQIVAILFDKAGLEPRATFTDQQAAVVWAIRLPRVALAVLVGASLAVSGAALQGVFRNPLADPGLIGVSSGAALGAVSAVIAGIAPFGLMTTPVAAFAGGVLMAMAVYALARHDGRTEVVTLLLTGIAVNAMAGAVIGFFIFVADDQQLRTIVVWTLGSVGGATWRSVLATLPFVTLGLVLLPRWGKSLNLFVLGEREARHLGVDTERTRLALIAVTAMTTGAAVAMAGIIGFVGLVVPHLIRLIAGPDHRTLLPASALAGASLLLLSDLVARTVATPAELPIGIVTALAGGPFFLFLLIRTRARQGGWA